jgi:hypothetical protein
MFLQEYVKFHLLEKEQQVNLVYLELEVTQEMQVNQDFQDLQDLEVTQEMRELLEIMD